MSFSKPEYIPTGEYFTRMRDSPMVLDTRTLRVQTYSTSQQVPQWLRGFSGFGLAYFLLEDYAEAIQALSFDVLRIRGKEFKKVCEIDPECAFKALFTNDYYSFWK